ncbi:MAG: alpha/beta hydrolase [Candidatus Krumholzibacteria bacterium]|nr:alpha/beta hydrolase [Candidatus Krumholzibacteria bacterium]
MKRLLRGLTFICAILMLSNTGGMQAAQAADASWSVVEGAWAGTLDARGTKLRIVFRVAKDADGSWKTLMDSPDQGVKDIAVSETIVKGDSLIFKSAAVRGTYDGLIQPDGKTALGTWKQGGVSFPLTLSKTDQVPTINRPQEPKPPFPYKQEEVVFKNEKAGIVLSGTLTLPERGGPFAAVAMISGSGPQDRDELLLGHKPFLVIADYLTRRGVAVLRYDDRGVGKSTGDFAKATSVDFASDALAAVTFLKSREDVNSKRIGLAGHSEGAIIAPMVANQSGDVAFVILLAGPGMNGEELLYLQAARIQQAMGVDEKTIAGSEATQRKIFGVLNSEKDDTVAAKKLREILNEAAEETKADEKAEAGSVEAAIDMQIKQVLNPWFRYFIAYDPVVELNRLHHPVLALWGEKDLQVPPKENMPLVEQALKKAGNEKAILKVLPGLNHLFQTANTGSVSEYAQIEETFSPAALTVIGDWIAERTAK